MMNYYTLIWKWPYNRPIKYKLSTLIEKSKFMDEIVYLQCASFAPTFVVLEKWNVNVTSDWDYDGFVPLSTFVSKLRPLYSSNVLKNMLWSSPKSNFPENHYKFKSNI